jgi:uncharacterized protein
MLRGPHLRLGLLGLALGLTLSEAGFSDYGELHRMFVLADHRLLLTFAGAAGIAGLGFALFCRGDTLPHRRIHRGTVPGAALFGLGWAICGACPAVALVQIGEGRSAALATALGILAGIRAGQMLHRRWPWDAGSCG